jgi:transcriptional regulator with XRE-family HTH domain
MLHGNPMDNHNIVGLRIRKTREGRGWSQVRLADEAGLHKNTICHIERTGSSRISTLREIAQALKIDIKDLIAPARRRRKVRR